MSTKHGIFEIGYAVCFKILNFIIWLRTSVTTEETSCIAPILALPFSAISLQGRPKPCFKDPCCCFLGFCKSPWMLPSVAHILNFVKPLFSKRLLILVLFLPYRGGIWRIKSANLNSNLWVSSSCFSWRKFLGISVSTLVHRFRQAQGMWMIVWHLTVNFSSKGERPHTCFKSIYFSHLKDKVRYLVQYFLAEDNENTQNMAFVVFAEIFAILMMQTLKHIRTISVKIWEQRSGHCLVEVSNDGCHDCWKLALFCFQVANWGPFEPILEGSILCKWIIFGILFVRENDTQGRRLWDKQMLTHSTKRIFNFGVLRIYIRISSLIFHVQTTWKRQHDTVGDAAAISWIEEIVRIWNLYEITLFWYQTIPLILFELPGLSI